MAQVFAGSARYLGQEPVRKRHALWGQMMLLTAVAGIILGFILRGLFPEVRTPPWPCILATIALGLIVWGANKWSFRKIEELERERPNLCKPADGLNSVATILKRFPNEFRVINDLTTPSGNLDHVVVGPTGVFVLDTKNWGGVVSADGQGELLCNGKPLDKPYVGQFAARVKAIKDKVKALGDLDRCFQALLVFTSARLDANWGTTGSVHCIRDDQLFDYIVLGKPLNRLNPEEIGKIARSLLGLARMDADFAAKAAKNARPRISAIVQRQDDRANPPLIRLTPSLGRSRN
jgi:hypothetical protein